MLDVTLALIILGIIMLLGFVGNFIFNRTQIPSIVWLLVFGLIVGFIFNVRNIDPNLLMTVSKFFAAIAIVIILFDGGINTDLYQLFKGAPRGLLLTISAFSLSILATMLIVVALSATIVPSIPLENSVIIGVIMGAIIGLSFIFSFILTSIEIFFITQHNPLPHFETWNSTFTSGEFTMSSLHSPSIPSSTNFIE